MPALKPTSHVSNDPDHCEVIFTVSGLWDLHNVEQLVADLNKAAWPLTKLGRPIHVLGAMEGFVAQSRETGDAIRDHLIDSRQFGLSRVAIYGASSLVKMQYKRLSEGLDVGFFETRLETLQWLRRPYD